MVRRYLLAISGIDGSGKSTQIQKLKSNIFDDNTKVIWLKFGYTPGLEFIKRIYLKIRGIKKPSGKVGSSRKPDLTSSELLFWLALTDYIFYYTYICISSYINRYNVIFDRYHIDSYYEVESKFGALRKKDIFLNFIKNLPSVHSHLVLIVPPDISKERSLNKEDIYAESLGELEKKFEFYMSLSEDKLDASPTEDLVYLKVLTQISLMENFDAYQLNSLNYALDNKPKINSETIARSFYKIPKSSVWLNRSVGLTYIIKNHPELWHSRIQSYKYILRFITLATWSLQTIIGKFQNLFRIASREKGILSFRIGRTSTIFFSATNEIITCVNPKQRDLIHEVKCRKQLINLPSSAILDYSKDYIREKKVIGVPLNRATCDVGEIEDLAKLFLTPNDERCITASEYIDELILTCDDLINQYQHTKISQSVKNLIIQLKNIMLFTDNIHLQLTLNHNDLHHGNILITGEHQCMVIDFEDVGWSSKGYDQFVFENSMRTTNNLKIFSTVGRDEVNDKRFGYFLSEVSFRLTELKRTGKKNTDEGLSSLALSLERAVCNVAKNFIN